MFVGGKEAKRYRQEMARTFLRYKAGDPLLLAELEANAASHDPLAQLARESLAHINQAKQSDHLPVDAGANQTNPVLDNSIPDKPKDIEPEPAAGQKRQVDYVHQYDQVDLEIDRDARRVAIAERQQALTTRQLELLKVVQSDDAYDEDVRIAVRERTLKIARGELDT